MLMSGPLSFRGMTLLVALAASACATTREVPPTQSLLNSMEAPRPATLASCKAANMALVCHGSFRGRVPSLNKRCACMDLEKPLG
jgi:hypothetical protein